MSNLNSSLINHVAIIMDGNGRWAQERFHRRVWGHVRGARNVSSIVEEAVKMDLKALTLYTFSTENWSRPIEEISTLFKLFKKFMENERQKILERQIVFKILGSLDEVPAETRKLAERLQEETKYNRGMRLNLAFSYGGRQELVSAMNRFIEKNPNKVISERDLEGELFSAGSGDVDILIRTGGDQRVSNFLLWQIAYSELYFTETKWPDFSIKEFKEIVDCCRKRERRFGAVCASPGLSCTTEQAISNKKNILER